MRWVSAVAGSIVVVLAWSAWPLVSIFVTRTGGQRQSPGEFEIWWTDSMRWWVIALGALAITSAVTTRRRVLVALAVVLGAGFVSLALWRLAPPDGVFLGYRGRVLVGVPWICLVALAVAALVAAWRVLRARTPSPA
jgi:hypothetical protein